MVSQLIVALSLLVNFCALSFYYRLDRQTQATSFIHQVFGGYLRSRGKSLFFKVWFIFLLFVFLCLTACVILIALISVSVKRLNCKAVSDTFDPFLDITLEIKVIGQHSKWRCYYVFSALWSVRFFLSLSVHIDCSKCLQSSGAVCQARTAGWRKCLQMHQVSQRDAKPWWVLVFRCDFCQQAECLFPSGAKKW